MSEMVQNQWIFRLFRMTRRSCGFSGGVPRRGRDRLAAVMAALALVLGAQGQTTATAIDDAATPQDVVTALHQMADRAGVIFVGRVAEVRRRDGGGVASGVVEVTFEVDQAIRGCAAGTPFVLREWAGLWEGDDQRYRTGQRLLMLLHAPNAAGMSSPVDGMDGAIPIVRGGSAPLAANSSARVAPPAVDLRWVGTKLLHPVSYGSGTARAAHLVREPVHAVAEGATVHNLVVGSSASATSLSAADSPGSASVPAQQASVDVVVGMLTSWQKVQHAVR
jgi:hypothetical protein